MQRFTLKEYLYILRNQIRFDVHMVRDLKEARYNESLSYDEMEALNFQKRKEIVEYAYNNTTFYRNYYDKRGFNPSMLKSNSDWYKVPIIVKEDIRNNFDDIIVKGARPRDCIITSTGGSTGAPLKIIKDKRVPYDAILARSLYWYGISFADNRAYVGRGVAPDKKWKQLLRSLCYWPTKVIGLNSGSISDSQLDVFVKKIQDKKMVILSGYVATIMQVARYVVTHDVKIHCVKLVWVTSAPISEGDRVIIKRAFNCEIMDQYGSGEVSCLAMESPEHIGLYVPSDYRHIDIVDDDNNPLGVDVYGNIVATDLQNKSFPIIRYRNADKSKMLSKRGRLPYPLIAPVQGRVSDYIVTPIGITIDGIYLTTLFDDYPDAVIGFQLVQHKDYSITVRIVVSHNDMSLVEQAKMSAVESLHRMTQNSVKIQVVEVDTLLSDRGKTRYIINELTNNVRRDNLK